MYAVNPLAASRYRERHTFSRAKSDRADARMLADLVRTDRQHHRVVAPDSELLAGIKVLARAHQNLIWTRQRQVNALRSALREYYPGALLAFEELGHPDALAVLALAPDPERGRSLTEAGIVTALRRGGRQRNLERRAGEIRTALRAPQLAAPPFVAEAQAANTVALVAVRRNYAGTAPITRASGTSQVVVARLVRNKRLFDAAYQWAFCALTQSAGARGYYDAHDPGPHSSKVARRKLANKLVGILHGCPTHRALYDEELAWHRTSERLAA